MELRERGHHCFDWRMAQFDDGILKFGPRLLLQGSSFSDLPGIDDPFLDENVCEVTARPGHVSHRGIKP